MPYHTHYGGKGMIDFLDCAFGGGRNGAYLLGLYERGTRPDLIKFADTGEEKPETYNHTDELHLF